MGICASSYLFDSKFYPKKYASTLALTDAQQVLRNGTLLTVTALVHLKPKRWWAHPHLHQPSQKILLRYKLFKQSLRIWGSGIFNNASQMFERRRSNENWQMSISRRPRNSNVPLFAHLESTLCALSPSRTTPLASALAMTCSCWRVSRAH
jgi:hypothetical protein